MILFFMIFFGVAKSRRSGDGKNQTFRCEQSAVFLVARLSKIDNQKLYLIIVCLRCSRSAISKDSNSDSDSSMGDPSESERVDGLW
jgi:hypothetical protein